MRALILTAIPIEYKAVRRFLNSHQEIETPDGTIFEKCKYGFDDTIVDVYIGQCGMGNVNSAIYTERAIKSINPSLVLFVGIAGGIKDVNYGDVVLASKIYSYESAKDSQGYKARPDGNKCTYFIVQRGQYEATVTEWKCDNTQKEFNVLVGPICTGEKVLSDKKSELFNFIREHYNDSLAVEMEGKGFLDALYSNNCDCFAIVRGISDLIDKKEETDSEGYQQIASEHAAFFAFDLLKKVWKKVKPRVDNNLGIKISFPEKLSQKEIEQLLDGIKKVTKDMNIELETVTYGSTNLYLKISEESYLKLTESISNGKFKQITNRNPSSIKQYLPSFNEVPITLELNRVTDFQKQDLKNIYGYLSKWKLQDIFDDFSNIDNPSANLSCAITVRHKSSFEFISTNKISLIGTDPRIRRSNVKTIVDFARCERNILSHSNFPRTFLSFEKDFKSRDLAIFRTSLNSLTQRILTVLVEFNAGNLHSYSDIINQVYSQTGDTETYVIITNSNDIPSIKNSERLIVNSFIKQEEEENEESE